MARLGPIISELSGRFAGDDWPQLLIDRADLHRHAWSTKAERSAIDTVPRASIICCTRIDQDATGVIDAFSTTAATKPGGSQSAAKWHHSAPAPVSFS